MFREAYEVQIDGYTFHFGEYHLAVSTNEVSASPDYIKALVRARDLYEVHHRLDWEASIVAGNQYLPDQVMQKYMELMQVRHNEQYKPLWHIFALHEQVYRKYFERYGNRNDKVAKPGKDTSGYVYLVQSPTSAYKIGKTVDPDNRMKTFTVKLPFEVDYVCLIETDRMSALETELHAMFEHKRVNGEWFDLDETDVEYIKSLAVAS